MKIWYSSYQLVPRSVINSRAKTKFRNGAILRVRFDDGKTGFSDLCPFAEMGDRPLERELKDLVGLNPSAIGERSLHFARIDAVARSEERSLFDEDSNRNGTERVRIKNHFLIHDILRFDLVRVAQLEAAGYTEIKVKMGWDLQAETERLDQLCARSSHRLRFRLDFNMSLGRERFVYWFEKNQGWLRARVEFFEDPFAYDHREWREVSEHWNIPLALDFAPLQVKLAAEGASILIVKPAVEDEMQIVRSEHNQKKKFVVTQYLDFPLGQMAAYYSAQKVAPLLGERLLSCGLQQHDVYQSPTFQEAIKNDGPHIVPPDGHGFGFDRLLESQKWIELS